MEDNKERLVAVKGKKVTIVVEVPLGIEDLAQEVNLEEEEQVCSLEDVSLVIGLDISSLGV